MTLRQCYEFTLIESNKLKAPSILLEDFIYLFNKAIQQYVNSVYNRIEYNQQSVDDLSFLQTISIIEVDDSDKDIIRQDFNDTIYKLRLPNDYLHLLNCMAEFKGKDNSSKCGSDIERTITSPCHRLTADLYPGIINNYYMRPSHNKPYYYIINHNDDDSVNSDITNKSMEDEINTGSYGPVLKDSNDQNVYNFYALKDTNKARVTHQSTVNIEIHTGSSNYKLNKIYVTYLKSPRYVSMTQEQILANEDTTENLEFPDYVCYEIINIYMRLFLENASDPRLQTNIPINQSIAVPGSNK